MSSNLEIGQQLHDGPIQSLTAAVLQLELVTRLAPDVAAEQSAINRSVTAALELTIEAIDDLRKISGDAMDEPISPQDLLGSLLTDSRRLVRGAVAVTIDGPSVIGIGRAQATALYLVGREAVANALFHADCSRVSITLKESGEHATLEIADDGHGFDADVVGAGHFGLRLMHSRMTAVGGVLELNVDRGVRVRATVPLIDPRSGPVVDAAAVAP